jgi:hypothetical protein
LVSMRSPSYTATVNSDLVFYMIRLGIVRKKLPAPGSSFLGRVNYSQIIVEPLFSIL